MNRYYYEINLAEVKIWSDAPRSTKRSGAEEINDGILCVIRDSADTPAWFNYLYLINSNRNKDNFVYNSKE